MSVRIYLTGRVAIEVDGKVVINERQLRGKQGRLIFAYLVCESARPVSREELATVVWPDHMAASAESALRAGQPASALSPATVVASIARRPFLSGVDGFWADAQRSKLERQLLRSLDCICQMQIQRGESAAAVETAIEAVALDLYRELTHQHLMQAYAATGNRAKAVSVYHEFSKLLANEMGSDPSPETEALYLELLG